ncbi:MAG TPA: preprotein translocase subunit SecG [Candidatus Binatia bacterium]|nr:preprotein translocase subunit SecG [Candidatus Binatia bacterium]
MATVVTIIHVLACIFLVLVVLLQTGKGADMGAVFGGSSSTIFGSSGAGNFLTRMTTVMAAVFMLTSLTLTYVGSRRVTSTVFDTAPLPAAPIVPQPENVPPAEAPAPGAGAPAPAAEAQPAPQAANPEPQAAAEPAAPAAPAPQEAPAAK